MKKKLFEVFLGTYNAEPWISEIIESLEAQNCEPFTVKIIDNDSTDNTVSILQNLFNNFSFKNEYELIQNNNNVGAISNLMDNLELFNSEWIIMIHQDDYYHTNHISTLINVISSTESNVSTIFTAMKRIAQGDKEIFTPPTLASKLNNKNRFENFLLSIQINPVNFPACALRTSFLRDAVTSRHTTAFNDNEMLIRFMCISEFLYVPIETMHYRIHSGNAMTITNELSNDHATLIGLNEILHSLEYKSLLKQVDTEEKIRKLVSAIRNAVEIRMNDEKLKIFTHGVLSESLIRNFGYKSKSASDYLIYSLNQRGLISEMKLVNSLAHNLSQKKITLESSIPNLQSFRIGKSQVQVSHGNLLARFSNLSSINLREKIYDVVFNSPLFKFSKRPFIKVWRSKEKRGK